MHLRLLPFIRRSWSSPRAGPRRRPRPTNKREEAKVHRNRLLGCAALLAALTAAGAQPPLRSGLAPGVRPGPYSALVCTGPERGQQHCYICEAEDRPVVIVFAR